MAREQIQIYKKTHTADISSLTDSGSPIDVRNIGAPFALLVTSENGGASAPTGALALQVRLLWTPDLASDWEVVAFLTSTAITATGKQLDITQQGTVGEQGPAFVQVQDLATAATAWNNGSTVTAYLIGEKR
jgi:hypothetical protein